MNSAIRNPMTVFDHIISGGVPASFVHRDEHCVAFMDLRPMSPGHVLVVPCQPVATLAELDPAILAQLWRIAVRVATAQQQALGSLAQHFLVNDGRDASQSVPHVHIHVIPRYRDDRWRTVSRMMWHVATLGRFMGENAAQRQRLEQQAQAIAAAMSAVTPAAAG